MKKRGKKENQQKHQRKTMNKNNDTVTETQQMNNI